MSLIAEIKARLLLDVHEDRVLKCSCSLGRECDSSRRDEELDPPLRQRTCCIACIEKLPVFPNLIPYADSSAHSLLLDFLH